MTVRINKQKINLREKLTEFEDKVNFDEVVRGLGQYTGNVGIGTTSPGYKLDIQGDSNRASRITLTRTDVGRTAVLSANSDSPACPFVGSQSNNDFAIHTNGSAKMLIDTDGNVGIGTTNPGRTLHIADATNDGSGGLKIQNYKPVIELSDSSGSATATTLTQDQTKFTIANNSVNALTIDSAGNVGIGTSDTSGQLYVKSAASSQTCRMYRSTNISTARVFDILSNFGGTNTVQFLVNANGTTQNTSGTISQISSDERLKENISDANPKLQDLLKLKVKNFNFSDDENKTKYIGFVAQEMEEVFPSLVMTKDTREYDEDGNLLSGLEDSKSTKVSMDFAILTKAIQEQQSIIEDLKSRIETLESK